MKNHIRNVIFQPIRDYLNIGDNDQMKNTKTQQEKKTKALTLTKIYYDW